MDRRYSVCSVAAQCLTDSVRLNYISYFLYDDDDDFFYLTSDFRKLLKRELRQFCTVHIVLKFKVDRMGYLYPVIITYTFETILWWPK